MDAQRGTSISARARGGALGLGLLLAGALVLAAAPAAAHCDALDGPVVEAARQAIGTGDVNRVLIWVRPQDVGEITAAFDQTLAVRRLGPQARDLADRHFFETLVRIHRAGENAPFDGLKPAGQDLGPAIPAADRALQTGSDEAVTRLVVGEVQAGLRRRFEEVRARRGFAPGDVAAGRAYVAAYVGYIHHVERLYEAARAGPGGGLHAEHP